MNYKLRNSGFSLTEVLIAVGILSVGMIFVAGAFPAGIYLTTIATERTIAAVATDEAFAKIKIYGIDPGKLLVIGLKDFNSVSATINIAPCEFEYPSTDTGDPNQYCWSALCGPTEAYNAVTNPNPPVQVIVFVCRKVSPNLKYLAPPVGGGPPVDWPGPVRVSVSPGGNANELQINGGKEAYFSDGCTIVDHATGQIYRVLERYKAPADSTILLDRNWQGGSLVWVVPPPVIGNPPVTHGRYPCIAVYPNVIRF